MGSVLQAKLTADWARLVKLSTQAMCYTPTVIFVIKFGGLRATVSLHIERRLIRSNDDSLTGQRELGRLSNFKPLIVSTYSVHDVRTLYQHGRAQQLFKGCITTDGGVDTVGIQEHRLISSNKSIPNRIITTTFHGNPKLTVRRKGSTLLNECASIDDKSEFYNNLENLLEPVKTHNIHLVPGDFNARLEVTGMLTHPEVIGRHCFYDTTNNNRERLMSMCEEHKLRPAQMKFSPI